MDSFQIELSLQFFDVASAINDESETWNYENQEFKKVRGIYQNFML